jgi:MFS family permease
MAESKGLAEWRRYWFLPFVAAIGASSSTLGIYGMAPFIKPLEDAFGWSRTEVTLGTFIASGAGIISSVFVGMLNDRFGPRILGLIGVAWVTLAFAALGMITGAMTNWVFHWLIIAVGACLVTPTIWASAVSTRFVSSRGLALAVTLSGATIGSGIFPPLGTFLIQQYGVKGGFTALGLLWCVLIMPLLFFFFRGANDGRERRERERAAAVLAAAEPDRPAPVLTGLTVSEGLRGGAVYKLALAGGIYSLVLVGLIVHLQAFLQDHGLSPIEAAAKAGSVAIFSVIGRLSTGTLMDHLRPDLVGGTAFLLPIIGCSLLMVPEGGTVVQLLAIAFIGLSIGAELDVITYLSTRYFGMRSFGRLFGFVLMPMAIGTASSPLLAAAFHDYFKSYDPFLWLTMGLMVVGGIALFTLGRPPVWEAEPASTDVAH